MAIKTEKSNMIIHNIITSPCVKETKALNSAFLAGEICNAMFFPAEVKDVQQKRLPLSQDKDGARQLLF